MALDDESVHAEIHSLLAEWCDEVASSTDVAWVVDDRKVWNTPAQLNRNLPHREVTVNLFVVA